MRTGDVARCFEIRTRTRENALSRESLEQAGITERSVTARLASTHRGWVVEVGGDEAAGGGAVGLDVVGFAMADRSNGELWVVAVLPEHEGRGIGTRLVEAAQSWLHANGWPEVWLRTSPDAATRAHALYRKLGWRDCGVRDGQLVMRRRRAATPAGGDEISPASPAANDRSLGGRTSLLLERVETPTDDARSLIEELEAELSGPYAADQRHGLSVAQVFRPNVRFFVARLDGRAVGCGGMAVGDGVPEGAAEVKRMYVRPPWRGRAVGRALLARLEDEARARGVGRLVLETGDVLHPAIRLYEAAGFVRCAAFGAYADMPARSIERSIFLEKRLLA